MPPALRMSHFGADGGLEPSPVAHGGLAFAPIVGVLVAATVAVVAVALLLRTRRALAAAEARFHQLAEQGSDVMLRLRGATREASTSVIDLIGYTAEEMSNLDWGTLIHPDDLERCGRRAIRLPNARRVRSPTA